MLAALVSASIAEAQSTPPSAVGDADLTDVAHRSSLDQLTDWTRWADKVLVF
jgi:hypothetical protein